MIVMGTIESSETLAFADYLRSIRSTTQADADAVAHHDAVTAADRFDAVQAHSVAAPAAH